MVLCFLGLALFVIFVLWCVSDNFKFAVLNRYVLRKLNSRIKSGFLKVKTAEIGFQYLQSEEERKMIKDTLICEMNKLNDDYKYYMCPIDEARKKCTWLKFIYENKFNECIETVTELERQYNDLMFRYKNKYGL